MLRVSPADCSFAMELLQSTALTGSYMQLVDFREHGVGV